MRFITQIQNSSQKERGVGLLRTAAQIPKAVSGRTVAELWWPQQGSLFPSW